MTITKNHAEILGRARQALQSARFDGAFSAHGKGTVHGVAVRGTRTCDREGRVVEIVDGSLGHRAGFDGHAGWRVDESGMPGPLDLGDLETFLVVTAVWSGSWAHDDGLVRI